MFVLEVSKPTGVCLAAVDISSQRLIGYLILSRYDTVWHLMNVAVDPRRRREGIATGLLEAMIDAAGADSEYTLEVRTSNAGAIALYERFGFRSAGTRPRYYRDTGEDAVIMWRTRDTVTSSGRGVILAIETSCDDTCAAVDHRRAARSWPTSSRLRASTTASGGSSRRSPRASIWS